MKKCVHVKVVRQIYGDKNWYCLDCSQQFIPFLYPEITGKITKRLKRDAE